MADWAGNLAAGLMGGYKGFRDERQDQRREALIKGQDDFRKAQVEQMKNNAMLRQAANERAKASFQTPEQKMQSAKDLATFQSSLQSEQMPMIEKEVRAFMGNPDRPLTKDDLRNYLRVKSPPSQPSGSDLAFAAGPDGSGQYFSKKGVLPQGYNWSTPKATEAAAKEAKQAEVAKVEAVGTANKMISELAGIRKLAEDDSFLNPTVGFGAETMSDIGGTRAADLKAKLSVITSNLSFGKLLDIKKSGGSLGALSDSELRLLGAAEAALSQSQSKDQFLKSITTLENLYGKVLQGGGPRNADGSAVRVGEDEPQKGETVDGYEFLGGDKADPNSWRKL